MIESDSKYKQSISDNKNFSALANQNSIIKKVLISKRFFKRDLKLKFNLSSWNDIKNDDSNNQNFFNWLSTESSSTNKILNKNSHQSESIMSETLKLNNNYF